MAIENELVETGVNVLSGIEQTRNFSVLKTRALIFYNFMKLNKDMQLSIYLYCEANIDNKHCAKSFEEIRSGICRKYFSSYRA